MTGQPLVILADDLKMAERYAQMTGLGPREAGRWVYAMDWTHVVGRYGGRFVVVTAGALTGVAAERRMDLLRWLDRHDFVKVRLP